MKYRSTVHQPATTQAGTQNKSQGASSVAAGSGPSDGQKLDSDGYRRNVGIIVCNRRKQVLWARRIHKDGWQFPQGGVEGTETIEQAVFRELGEEVGLSHEHVRLVGRTQQWLHYDLPERLRRLGAASRFRGQKQIWFYLNW